MIIISYNNTSANSTHSSRMTEQYTCVWGIVVLVSGLTPFGKCWYVFSWRNFLTNRFKFQYDNYQIGGKFHAISSAIWIMSYDKHMFRHGFMKERTLTINIHICGQHWYCKWLSIVRTVPTPDGLTYLRQVPHICVSESGQHWFI